METMKYAYRRMVGKRTTMGTDWPIEVLVYPTMGKTCRSRNVWTLAVVCNGIADSSREFRTRREAVEAAKEY